MTAVVQELEIVTLDGNEQDPEDLIHICCDCEPDLALCGLDLAGFDYWVNVPEEDECVVCVDLAGGKPCVRCGAPVR